jgi:hypothetical protein
VITTTQRPKGGELAKLAGLWSGEQAFWDWIAIIQENPCHCADDAAAFIRAVCGVESRALLDHVPAAKAKFHQHIRTPYSKYRASVGCA